MKIPVHLPIASAASSSAAAASESSMPPIEIPDDLLTMTGVIAGSGMCSGSAALYHRILISVIILIVVYCSSNGRCCV